MACATASAEAQRYVACEWAHLAYKVKPKRCTFNLDAGHSNRGDHHGMRWRSWGGRTACGRGYLRYNAGYRTRTRFCLYAWRPDGYMRIRGVVGRRYCSYLLNGDYRCGLRQRPYHYRSDTL